ncbi:MAG: ABC transporter permease [Clostridia bacterium]|nr:ABC transporter permease [Clostridia bacterium]
MLKYIMKRILAIIPVVIAVSFIVFFIMDFVPTDAAVTALGDGATEEELEYYRDTHGLNDPLPVRYVRYMAGIFHGDLGTSYANQMPVWDLFFDKFPNTLRLALASVVVTVLLSLPLGILAAVKENTWVDTVCSTISFVGLAMPNFWLGLLLIMLFAVNLHWLPSTGAEGFKSLILPAITCGTGNMAALTRITRSSMLDVLRQDYLRTARSKGQSERNIIFGHAFRNAQIPVVTQIGIQMSTLIGGAVLTERVFAWPGVGAFMVDSIQKSDFEVVTGFVIMLAIFVSLVLLLVDVLYALLDPRIKAQYSKN